MRLIPHRVGHEDLVRPPRTLHFVAVDNFRSCPALGEQGTIMGQRGRVASPVELECAGSSGFPGGSKNSLDSFWHRVHAVVAPTLVLILALFAAAQNS